MKQPNISLDRRVAPRTDIARPVAIVTHDGRACEGKTVNVSTSGMLVVVAGDLTIWSEVAAMIPRVGERAARIVRREGDQYGLVFRQPLSPVEFSGFTGISIPEKILEADIDTPPLSRVSPQAFGRDKVRMVRRIAAERASGSRS